MKHFLMIAVAAVLLSGTGSAQAAQTAKAPIANQFSSEADAKAHCPGDQIVWANTNAKRKIYHLAGDRYYGTTKHGGYMCQKDSDAEGFRAAKPRFAAKAPKA